MVSGVLVGLQRKTVWTSGGQVKACVYSTLLPILPTFLASGTPTLPATGMLMNRPTLFHVQQLEAEIGYL